METLLDQTFPASTEVLSEVRLAVRDACQHVCRGDKSGEECGEQMVLAINEACMNIIQHGYGFADGQQFTLRLGVDDGVLKALLLDNGLPASILEMSRMSMMMVSKTSAEERMVST